jgi:hypothetical protein
MILKVVERYSTFSDPNLSKVIGSMTLSVFACAAPGLVYTTEACAAPGRVYTTGA